MDYITQIFVMAITAIFVQNIILARFLGLCSYLGVSKKLEDAFGMGMAVIFVLVMASAMTWMIQYFILVPLKLEYLQTIAFILTIAVLVQFVEMVIQKMAPALYKALGIYLPLITTNCAVLGIAIINIQAKLPNGKSYNFLDSVFNALFYGLGYTLIMILMAGIRERLAKKETPLALEGFPLAMLIGGCMALAFLGFSGLKV